LLALASRRSDFIPLSPTSFALLCRDSLKLSVSLFLTPDGLIGALLQATAHFIHLVEDMKTIIALLGQGKDLSDARLNA
jgi:hypothetical protein